MTAVLERSGVEERTWTKPDSTQHHGWQYDTRIDLTPPATVTRLVIPAEAVADLLP
jgi:hypothetical protein